MRHSLVITSFFVSSMITALGVFLIKGRTSEGATLEFSQNYDLGNVEGGATVGHTFYITNPYAEDIRVANVESSCACSILKNPPTHLPARFTIPVTLEIHAPQTSSPFEGQILLNLQGRPTVALKVRGRAINTVPKNIDFGSVKFGETARQFVRFSDLQGNSPDVTKFYSPCTKLRLAKAVQGDVAGWELILDEPPTEGSFKLDVDIITSNEPERPKKLSVLGFGVPRVMMKQQEIAVNLKSESDTFKIQITTPYGDSVSLDDVKVTSPTGIAFQADRTEYSRSGLLLYFQVTPDLKENTNRCDITARVLTSSDNKPYEVTCTAFIFRTAH